MKLTLVRHGETSENVAGIMQGQLPGHLTERGKQQAIDLAEHLSGEAFDVIYSSDLQRCLDTAIPIRALYPDVPFITDTLIRERKGGDKEGQNLDSEEWDNMPGTEHTRRYPNGGESWDDVRLRVKVFLNRLYDVHPDANVLVVTHGGALRGMRCWLESISLDDMDWAAVTNASIWPEQMEAPFA